ncbi:MAG: D-glycero-beta-D-manno-heptose 1-phosphate adenylyltransferase [Bacteroidales bacterium]|nr:D-glycero-beta-D-manno-heptose 1-phosphate adenylyltransferase [Bacteroidales bacterium]MBN2763172.1 D-glycero-beta-D-manno-heptose 1-phosphate adenylyltransferase [Bacteroidales bacterium]
MDRIACIQTKILDDRSLEIWLALVHFKKQKIVFTNGCFDILHQGHVTYLSKAADAGDVLIIGLNSDSSVRKLKGSGRPVIGQESRAFLLAALPFVSAVILFDEETPYRLIEKVQPDILVKGSDYKPEEIVGYDIVKARGGKVLTIDFLEGYSSSSIINKIADKK